MVNGRRFEEIFIKEIQPKITEAFAELETGAKLPPMGIQLMKKEDIPLIEEKTRQIKVEINRFMDSQLERLIDAIEPLLENKEKEIQQEKKVAEVRVNLNAKQAEQKVEELVELLKRANSLTDELANKLEHLEINIESCNAKPAPTERIDIELGKRNINPRN